MTTRSPTGRGTPWGALAADLAAVAVFIALGRRTHTEPASVMGYLATLAPFLVGLASGWVVLRLVRWPVTAVRSGLLVAMLTWAVGLLLRATLWQDGTAIAFVVVAGVFLLGTMVGWRVLVTSVGRRARGRSEELTGQAAVVGRDG